MDRITITLEELRELQRAKLVLECLMAAGVMEWEGWSKAYEAFMIEHGDEYENEDEEI